MAAYRNADEVAVSEFGGRSGGGSPRIDLIRSGGHTILKPYDTVVYYYLYGHIGIHWKYYSLVDCVHVAWRERSAQDFYKYRGRRVEGKYHRSRNNISLNHL